MIALKSQALGRNVAMMKSLWCIFLLIQAGGVLTFAPRHQPQLIHAPMQKNYRARGSLSVNTVPYPVKTSYTPRLTSVPLEGEGFVEDDHHEKPNSPLSRMRRRKVKILNKKKTYKVGGLFFLWYTLSVAYNIFSKKVLIMAPELAWTTAWFQMALGMLYVGPLWWSGARTPPELSRDDTRRLLPVAALHSLVHIGGVVSMGAGAVSFTYIVKASEPAVSAALSAVVLRSFLPLPVYLTLIPVMAGVALTSVSELSFSWKSFLYAMMSNVASATRGIVGKKTMGKRLGKNLNAANLYAVLTLISSVLLLPVTLLLEGSLWKTTFEKLVAAGQASSYAWQLFLAAFFYYTYNEVSFLCLDEVSPVSHAIGNTLKRVAIILSSILVFRNKLTPQGILGSVMAIGGVLMYSLAKTKLVPKKAKN